MPEEIKESIINEIRTDRKAGLTIKEICERHRVSDFTVKKYCKGIKSGLKKGAPTILAPERKAEQVASKIIAQEMAKIAEEETRKRLEAGKMAVTELGRVAELYGMEPAQYVRWLQDQFLERGEPKNTWADKWKEFKDFGLSCIYARGIGVDINPNIIPLAYMLTKLEYWEEVTYSKNIAKIDKLLTELASETNTPKEVLLKKYYIEKPGT